MTDERSLYFEEETDAEDDDVREQRERRSLLTPFTVTVAVIIILLMLMMLRSNSSFRANSSDKRSTTKQIVPVKGREPIDSQVSLWLAPDASVQDVLSAAGLRPSEVVDMGGGRYVLTVPASREISSIRVLLGIDGVYDAGRVYSDSTL
jgi:hypothetical protein